MNKTISQWHRERATKPDVATAIACVRSGRTPPRSELAALGLAWLYRHGFVTSDGAWTRDGEELNRVIP